MMQTTIGMAGRKKIALVSHDNKKEELFEWAELNCTLLAEHTLYATGATGQLLASRLGLKVMRLECGPLGGDQQIGLESQKARLTVSSSSRTRWNRNLTILM
jgi:methylglyoxal synthase